MLDSAHSQSGRAELQVRSLNSRLPFKELLNLFNNWGLSLSHNRELRSPEDANWHSAISEIYILALKDSGFYPSS